MSDGLYASSVHNNLINWDVSASIDGSYSASFNLSNEESQYDDSIISAIYSSDNVLLQRACSLNWSPVEGYLDLKLIDLNNDGGITSLVSTDVATTAANTVPSTIPSPHPQGGARRHVFGLIESHGRAESNRSSELNVDIVSFTDRLRKKDLTDFVTTGATVKTAIEQVLGDIATLHTSLWDTSNCPLEEFVGFIDGDNIIECVRKLAQVAGADVFTNEFGILVVEAWKDHTSSIDYTIPPAMIRTVSKEIGIGDCPSQCTVTGKPEEEVDKPEEEGEVTSESVTGGVDSPVAFCPKASGEGSDTPEETEGFDGLSGDRGNAGEEWVDMLDGVPSPNLNNPPPENLGDRHDILKYTQMLGQGPWMDPHGRVPTMTTNPFEMVGRGRGKYKRFMAVREQPIKVISYGDRMVREYENFLYSFGIDTSLACSLQGTPQEAIASSGILWDECYLTIKNNVAQLIPQQSDPLNPGPNDCVSPDPSSNEVHPGMALQPVQYPWRLNATIMVKANLFAEGSGGNNRYHNGMRTSIQFHYLPFNASSGAGMTAFTGHVANTAGQLTGCFVDVIGQAIHVYYTGWCQMLEVVQAINANARAQKLVTVEHHIEYDQAEWHCNEAHGGDFRDYPSASKHYTSDGSGFLPTRAGGLQGYDPVAMYNEAKSGGGGEDRRGIGLTNSVAGYQNNYFNASSFDSPQYFLDEPRFVDKNETVSTPQDIKAAGLNIQDMIWQEEIPPRQKVITGRDAWTIRNMNEILAKQNEMAGQLEALKEEAQKEKEAEREARKGDQSRKGGDGSSAGGGKGGSQGNAQEAQSTKPFMSAEEAYNKSKEALRESRGIVQPVSGSGQKGGHEKAVGLQTQEDPNRIAATATDSTLRSEFGHVAVEHTNEFIATRAQCAKIASRVLQEAKMNRRRYSIDMMYSPKVGLNRVVKFTTPYGDQEVTGRVVDISIAYDRSPAATMSITVESFEDLGKTNNATSSLLGNPAMRQLDGKNWKSKGSEAQQARLVGLTDLTFKEDGIDSSSTDFVAAGFKAEQWVSVEGATSRYNNSNKLIRSVSTNNLTWRVNDTGEASAANDHNTSDAVSGINIYSLNVPHNLKKEARMEGGYITLQTFDSTHRGHVLDTTTSEPRGDCPGGSAEIWQEIKLQAGFYRLLFNARDDMISGGFDNLEFRVEAVDGTPSNVLIDTWTHNDLWTDKVVNSQKSRPNIPSTFTITSAEKYKLIFKTTRTGGFSTGVGNRIQISNVRLFTETTI